MLECSACVRHYPCDIKVMTPHIYLWSLLMRSSYLMVICGAFSPAPPQLTLSADHSDQLLTNKPLLDLDLDLELELVTQPTSLRANSHREMGEGCWINPQPQP